MAKGTIGSSGVAALCLFIGACTSSSPESPSTLSGTTSKAASSESKRAEKKLPLYEAHIRRVQGLRQTKADSPGQRLWGISFLRHKTGKACSSCRIWGDASNIRGRAYEYSSDKKILRLGQAAKPIDLVGEIGNFELVLRGFHCPPGPTTYAWTRHDHNLTLRLEATQESCEVRRAILEGDWRFSD
jgi:hypothetical protein